MGFFCFLFLIMSVLPLHSPTILPVLQKWSALPLPSPWSPCSSSSPPLSSATLDTSDRSAPSSPSFPEYSSYCQVAWKEHVHYKPVYVLSSKFEDILSYCTASLVVVSSYRPCFCAQKQGLQTIKNSVNTNFIPVCTQLQTPGFSCHGLFPYFPITLLCIVVIAKQPGRQTSAHNCWRNCGCKVCGEQTHFFRNTTCILLSVFMPKVKSSELHPTNGTDAPPVTNISPSFGWTSPSRSQRFMIK